MALRARAVESLGLTKVEPAFWSGRRVLLTGHTGFKGAWAAMWLAHMGAQVTGLALPPETDPNLYTMAKVARDAASMMVDIRDPEGIAAVVAKADPEIVLHMAAQPLVRRAITRPVETFEVNILGTVHLLESLRSAPSLLAAVVVTTDKVYENREDKTWFTEASRLGGHEPYGASKAAAEIATGAMAKAYFDGDGAAVATARGGNVIGGGDFSDDRLIPDIIRAVARGCRPALRNPSAIRPWQYVLDCLAGYFCYAQALAAKTTNERSLNFGPAANEVSVASIARSILEALAAKPDWDLDPMQSPHESNTLNVDSTKAREILGWRDHFPGGQGLAATAAWYLAWRRGENMRAISLEAIDAYMDAQNTAPDCVSIRKRDG
jgi:CDP-glucose 4,6-dehydratase